MNQPLGGQEALGRLGVGGVAATGVDDHRLDQQVERAVLVDLAHGEAGAVEHGATDRCVGPARREEQADADRVPLGQAFLRKQKSPMGLGRPSGFVAASMSRETVTAGLGEPEHRRCGEDHRRHGTRQGGTGADRPAPSRQPIRTVVVGSNPTVFNKAGHIGGSARVLMRHLMR